MSGHDQAQWERHNETSEKCEKMGHQSEGPGRIRSERRTLERSSGSRNVCRKARREDLELKDVRLLSSGRCDHWMAGIDEHRFGDYQIDLSPVVQEAQSLQVKGSQLFKAARSVKA